MKIAHDLRMIQGLAAAQNGVFSRSDLQVALKEPHATAFGRRTQALEEAGVLQRFARGWYVTEGFDLGTLSQRMAPGSYVSFETVLARRMIIGTSPIRRVRAIKVGKARKYCGLGFEIEHFSVAPSLCFGHAPAADGVRYANAEKAVLDALYFHLRGMRYVFDIYSDLAIDKLDTDRLVEYLGRYRNRKFVVFASRILELPT